MLGIQGRSAFLWEEQDMNIYVTLLNSQVNALTLLLSATHCRSLSQALHIGILRCENVWNKQESFD